jgi:hypothetical protein
MPRKLLYVTVDSITLVTNGEHPNVTDGAVKHALMATMLYPRSGAPTVTSALPVKDLARGTTDLTGLGFYSNGLFKEEVQDSTLLNVKVVNRQETSKIEKFIVTLFATVLGAGLGVVTGGLTGVLGAVSAFGVDALKGGIKGAGDDEVLTLGETNNIPINIAQIGSDEITHDYDLILKDEVVKRYIDPQTGQIGTYTITPGGNGSIRLRLRAEEL